MNKRLLAACAAVFSLFSCSPPTAPSARPLDSVVAPLSIGAGPGELWVGSGDIGLCGSTGAELTARLLDTVGGTIFTTGDNAYPNGTASNFRDCYDPSWGRHRHRTRPAPGNHEYDASPHAFGYFDYFGANAGPSGRGYYSYTVGSWHILSLNSEVDISPGSAQQQWLRGKLAENRTPCTAAYWHKPRFSSGRHGNHPHVRELWRTLYEFGVDLVVTGHDHSYERFAKQDADGRADPERGIRQFVIGTGGSNVYDPIHLKPNSEARGNQWGILAFTLMADSYRWEFMPVAGATYRDSGVAACH